jgi:hypothetical protein
MAPRPPWPQAPVIASRLHIAPPLIGVVTHELRAEPEPAWAPSPGPPSST